MESEFGVGGGLESGGSEGVVVGGSWGRGGGWGVESGEVGVGWWSRGVGGIGVGEVELGGSGLGGLELGGGGGGGGVGGWSRDLGSGSCGWFEITLKVL